MAGYMFPPMCCLIFQNQKRLTQSGRRSPIIKFPQTLSGQQLQSNLHEKMIITVIFQGMACDWNNSGANPSRGRRSPWIQRLVPGQMINDHDGGFGDHHCVLGDHNFNIEYES